MKAILIAIISFYQKKISPHKKPTCQFYPTCSQYTKEAIGKYGALQGTWKGVRRILRCHPWQKNHFDPIK